MKIGIVVFDGAEELDFIGPYEVLRAVSKAGENAEVSLLSIEQQTEVTAANGLKLRPDGSLDQKLGDKIVDVIVVPGGGWIDRASKGAWSEFQRGVLPKKIAELHTNGTIIAGVCAGTMLLAAAGILDGRPAITHQSIVAELQATKAHVVQARVVDAEDVITCGGVTASLDLAFRIVERFWGASLAGGIAELLEYTRSRDVYIAAAKAHSAVSQDPEVKQHGGARTFKKTLSL